ncbi:MAG: GntR family transcriptional regulator [Hyphomicrobiales bacterium]|nr:GntR family transcriptional regulator [Hyphomicrobiales bacterium]
MPTNDSSGERIDATAEVRRLPRRDNLSERIYLDLRGRLQRCAIGHDQRLVDLEVAAAYGTSRMPAREALLRLANEGYLVGTTRGFVTPKLSLADIRDIFEIRHQLEPLAAANAARDMTATDEALLTAAIEQARKAVANDDVERLILANINFRTAWLSAVRNERLANTIARFVDHVQTVRLSTLADHATRGVVGQGLEALHTAFRQRDAVAAATSMTNFLRAAERAFFAVRSQDIQLATGAHQGLTGSRQAGLAGRS